MTDSVPHLGNLPDIEKTIPCLKCAADTTHRLVRSKEGCAWRCDSCHHTIHAYTLEQMVKVVMQKVFGLEPNPKPVQIPHGLQVFLEYSGEGSTEMEASQQSVEAHVKATGRLPQVGKPLFASPMPGVAVPFGKVIRVVLNGQETQE